MKFHAIQPDVVPGNTLATEKSIESLLSQSQISKSDFVVLPEMSITGFSIDIDVVCQGDSVQWACNLARQLEIWVQVGWAKRNGNRATNCVTICSPQGNEIATYEKVFTCNPFGENQLIDKGDELVIVEIEGRKICPLICYDLRFPELWRLATIAGAEIFTNSANWPLKRINSWTSLLVARAIENQAQVIGANRVGQDDVAHWGGSSIAVSEEGVIIASADKVSQECVSVTFEKNPVDTWRNEFEALQDTNRSLLGNIAVRQIKA